MEITQHWGGEHSSSGGDFTGLRLRAYHWWPCSRRFGRELSSRMVWKRRDILLLLAVFLLPFRFVLLQLVPLFVSHAIVSSNRGILIVRVAAIAILVLGHFVSEGH